MAEDDGPRLVGERALGSSAVGTDGEPELPRVVAELADLGCCLVDEHQLVAGPANGARAKERIGDPLGDERGELGIVGRDAVAAHGHGDAGGIAPADLEPVERRERLLNRAERLDRGPAGIDAGQFGHGVRRPQPVVAQRPQRITGTDQGGVQLLDPARSFGHPILEAGLDDLHPTFHDVEVGDHLGASPGIVTQQDHADRSAQQPIGVFEPLGPRR